MWTQLAKAGIFMTWVGQSRVPSVGLCQSNINILFPVYKGVEIIPMPELLQKGNFTEYINVPHSVWNPGTLWSFVIASNLLEELSDLMAGKLPETHKDNPS